MNQIMVNDPLKTELQQLSGTVELVDETGKALGHFVPRAAAWASDNCPYSEDGLAEMHAEPGGRPLAEIWKSLGAK